MAEETPEHFVQVTWNLRNGNSYREDTAGTDVLKAYELLMADMARPGYVANIVLAEGMVKLVPFHAIDTVSVALVKGKPQFPWHRS